MGDKFHVFHGESRLKLRVSRYSLENGFSSGNWVRPIECSRLYDGRGEFGAVGLFSEGGGEKKSMTVSDGVWLLICRTPQFIPDI